MDKEITLQAELHETRTESPVTGSSLRMQTANESVLGEKMNTVAEGTRKVHVRRVKTRFEEVALQRWVRALRNMPLCCLQA